MSIVSTGVPVSQDRHEELQYLDLVRHVLDHGEHRPDRTGTGTYAVFAPTPLKFSLSNGAGERVLPLLTTKRVFLKAVVEELLWFVAGGTSSRPLHDKGVKIWDGNGSRDFLDQVGLAHRAEGDLGPVYGFQWRHFGADYVDAQTDYTGQGVDQLAEIIHKLRNTPHDRRIILSAWNPPDLPKMALPPCHLLAQFYVSSPRQKTQASPTQATPTHEAAEATAAAAPTSRGRLHCQLYQRSCDMGLGVPFNIASYALLTHMLAHVTDLDPGTLTHVMGDCHVYADHVDALRTQLERSPRAFPTLSLQARVEREGAVDPRQRSIDGWAAADFDVRGYEPHKAIPMKMSV